jgi:RHS repeat-associated protein
MAGAIFPIYSDPYTFSHYIFIDSSGTEYKLNFNDGGVWRGAWGVHVRYDEAAHKVYFNDGSFWQMDCIPAWPEQDFGTRYPTLMQDSNGNQVRITYMPGQWTGAVNTSGRIREIEDVRAVNTYWNGTWAYRTFQFNYNTDEVPRLLTITNNINTGEKYEFNYSGLVTLQSPFDSWTPPWPHDKAKMLTVVWVLGTTLRHVFEYANPQSGELTKISFPYWGELQYTHSTFTYAEGHKLREISERRLVKQPGAPALAYQILRDPADSTRIFHTSATLNDPGGVGQRYWGFSHIQYWMLGLQTLYEERALPGGAVKARTVYEWALAPSGFPYVGTTLATIDPGTSNEKTTKTEQTLDGHGNVLTSKAYSFTDLVNPARTTTCTYVTAMAYTSRHIRNLPLSCSLTAGGQTYTLFTNNYDGSYDGQTITGLRLHDSANYSASFTTRGNLTSWSKLGGTSGSVTFNMVGGTPTSSASGTTQQTSYNAAHSAPSQVTTNSNSQIQSTFGYTSFLGLSNASQANGTAVSFSYDNYARPTSRSTPDGTVTITYGSAGSWWSRSEIGGMWTKTYYDGFGRTIKEETGDGGGVKSTVETEYDSCACSPLGKLKRVSRPFAGVTNPGHWTTNTYDALGRTVSVALPGGAGTTTYSYAGNTATVTDPSGKWKKFTSDAFGQLVQVNEPRPGGGADYVTTYTYNGLGKLTGVSMPRPHSGGTYTQTRNFVYDTQGRMTSETNPETGTTTYEYDSWGRMWRKTDAKNQRTEWSFDNYQRVTQERHYNASQQLLPCETLDYLYDGGGSTSWGRLTGTRWGNPEDNVCPVQGEFRESYAYDVHGRMTYKSIGLKHRIFDGSATYSSPPYTQMSEGSISASWSWSFGRIVGVSYPNWDEAVAYTPPGGYTMYQRESKPGRSLLMGLDSMKRPATLVQNLNDGSGPTTVVDNVTYGAAGELTQIRYNGVNETRAYNTLGQLTGISYNGTLRHEYRYSATQNDGRITSHKNWQSGEDVQYQYDSLGRLEQAQTVGPEWGQSFGYDGWGNLLSKSVTKGSAPAMSVTADPATNRLVVSGMTYDANGSATNVPGVGAITYDGRNRLVTVAGSSVRRVYDAQNRIVARAGDWVQETTSSDRLMQSIGIDFYLPDGTKIGTYGRWVSSIPIGITFAKGGQEVHFAGRRIKVEGGNNQPWWYVEWQNEDRLGSNQRHHPYGETLGSSATEYKFATYQREASGLDYAHNRYYSSTYGRFLSSDPYRASGGPSDPGSWNRYAYVVGDPVNLFDPTGLLTIIIPGTFEADENPEWAQVGSEFNTAVSQTFGEEAIPFAWSGGNSDQARRDAAAALVDFVNARLRSGECLHIVAFSHGGNVAKLYSHMPGMKTICTLVTLGTPQRPDYEINRLNVPGSNFAAAVGSYFNISSYADFVQPLGGTLTHSAGRTDSCADNFFISATPSGAVGHGELHTVTVWKGFLAILDVGGFSSSLAGSPYWSSGLRNSKRAYTCNGRYPHIFADDEVSWPNGI